MCHNLLKTFKKNSHVFTLWISVICLPFHFIKYHKSWLQSPASPSFFRCSLVWILGSWWIWHRGFIGQMSLPGSLWKSSETFHPRLWRLDWDFLLLLQGRVFVMFSFSVLWESSDFFWLEDKTTEQLAALERSWTTVERNLMSGHEKYYTSVSLSPDTEIWTSLRDAFTPLGVRVDVETLLIYELMICKKSCR